MLFRRALLLFASWTFVIACSDSAERDVSGAGAAGAAGSGSGAEGGDDSGGAGGGVGGSGAEAGQGGGGNKPIEPGECHTQADCDAAESCGVPVDPVTCGTGDACGGVDEPVCPSGWTCGPPCECGGAGCFQYCLAPCSDVGCALGYTCQPDGLCAITACSGASECPETFDCVAGTCQPKMCASDADCGPGYCVQGACSVEPGICAELAA